LSITDEQWRANAFGIPAVLQGVPRDKLPDDGLPQAMLVVWSALATSNSTIKHLYSLIRESEILQVAGALDLNQPGYGLAFAGNESFEEIVTRLGGCLRAMEIEYTDWDSGSRPTNPQHWLVTQGGHSASLVPMGRLAWRDARDPADDMRNFDQRGLLRLRFIPSIVDGAHVRIVRATRVAREPAKAFGAVLFPGATFDCHETPTKFYVRSVGIPDGPAIVSAACKSAHEDGCLTAVFPELTVDPEARRLIKTQLAEKPWLTEGELPLSPGFVVAGSWHEMEGRSRYNIATIYNGHGVELARHKKRMAYKDPEGRVEDIRHGTEFVVVVLEEALFGFGICLDFCNRCYHTPYGWLDVDFVVVPSCGNDTTMSGHVRTAQDLHNERNTRSFVVQQAYPLLEAAAGYVLNPDGNPAAWSASALRVAVPWSVFRS
jgi:predicted amidohydrolase